jgi:tellurite resistance protein
VTLKAFPLIPASFFGIILGLAGLGAVWRGAHSLWGLPAGVGEGLYAVAGAVWAAVLILYALKWVIAPGAARDEAGHPVQCCFIGLAGVATMLMAQGALPYERTFAVLLFAAGSLFTLGFALWRTGLLWHGERDPAATTPVLYLPTVAGGFVAGNTAAQLGWPQWGQIAFGAAFFSWLAIESVLLHRLYTAPSMPAALRPTLGIQLAPPAVGVSAYVSVGPGQVDLLANALVGYALLQALLLLRLWRWIGEQGFAPSFWAFTFGATSMTAATLKLAAKPGGEALSVLAPPLFAATNLLLALITLGTLRLLFSGRLLPPVPVPTPPS